MKKKCFSAVSGIICIALMGALTLTGFTGLAEARAPYNLKFYSLPAGFPPYAIGVGVAELINKNSTWLKATSLEGRGPTEAMKFVVTDPEKKTNFFFFNQPKWVWSAAQKHPAFKNHPYDYMGKIKFVILIGVSANTLATLDPDIKTLKGFAGKKVAVDGGPGRVRQLLYEDMFRQAGVLGKVKFEYMRGGAAAKAMQDGLIDGCYIAWDLFESPNTWRANSWTTEMMTTKKVHFIPIPKQYFDNYKQRTGYMDHFIEFPPKFFSNLQTQPAGCFISHHSWCCHEDMPNDVITEVCRIIYENSDKLKQYHPSAALITKKNLGKMDVPESMVHPAALKFYKEKSITIGSFN